MAYVHLSVSFVQMLKVSLFPPSSFICEADALFPIRSRFLSTIASRGSDFDLAGVHSDLDASHTTHLRTTRCAHLSKGNSRRSLDRADRAEYSTFLLSIVALTASGCIIAAAGELRFSLFGFLCQVSAVVVCHSQTGCVRGYRANVQVESTRLVLMQVILRNYKLDPLSSIAMYAPVRLLFSGLHGQLELYKNSIYDPRL